MNYVVVIASAVVTAAGAIFFGSLNPLLKAAIVLNLLCIFAAILSGVFSDNKRTNGILNIVAAIAILPLPFLFGMFTETLVLILHSFCVAAQLGCGIIFLFDVDANFR